MNSFKFSVIIPCFNSWHFMSKALHSLENQELKCFEVVFVDDCSTDDTYNHLLSYQKRSTLNVQVLRNDSNCGPGESRNKGIRMSHGEYITFMDSDDWYETDFFQLMSNKLEQTSADIVYCDFYRCFGNGRKKWLRFTDYFTEFSLKNDFVAKGVDSLCSLCIKRQLFDTISIPTIYNAEDGAVIPVLLSKADKITFIAKPLYNYLYRRNSLSTSQNLEIVNSFCVASDFLKQHTPVGLEDEFMFRRIQIILYSVVLKGLQAKMKIDELNLIINSFKKEVPTWFHNPYIKKLPFRKRVFLKGVHYEWYGLLRLYSLLHCYLLN